MYCTNAYIFEGVELRLILEFSALCTAMMTDKFGSPITDSLESFHSWCMSAQRTSVIVRKNGSHPTVGHPVLKAIFKNVIDEAHG